MCDLHGVDTVAFRSTDRTGSLRRELGLPDESLLVAAIGQICLRKGQDVFAEAAVREASSLPAAHFLLIGSRHSAKRESIEYEHNLGSRFMQAGLAQRFHPLGERTDVARLLPEIDILVHAARQEPFGRVLLEASACGVPIIATDVGGTAEMLTNGEHALLVPPDDPAAIAEAVRRLVGDRELASQLGRAASRHVADRFPIERSAQELFALWNRTVEVVGRR
ncbi:MAG: glycosyltransferase family 4 protein [Planctomycetaceae bacterium]